MWVRWLPKKLSILELVRWGREGCFNFPKFCCEYPKCVVPILTIYSTVVVTLVPYLENICNLDSFSLGSEMNLIGEEICAGMVNREIWPRRISVTTLDSVMVMQAPVSACVR